MINAKDELISAIKDCVVIAATVTRGNCYQPKEQHFLLKENYSKADWNCFLEQLNFEYHDGYGGQELFGTVWLADGTWLGRGEYDGSEWWEHRAPPQIPDKLKSSKAPGDSVSDIERKEVVTYFGKPVESLSREDLIEAIYVVMSMYETARKERAMMAPFVDKRAMLMGSQ